MELAQLLSEIDEFLNLQIKQDHICTAEMQLSFTILQKSRDTLLLLAQQNRKLQEDNTRLRHFLKE